MKERANNLPVDIRTFAKRDAQSAIRWSAAFGFILVTLVATWLFIDSFKARLESSVRAAVSDMNNLFTLGDIIQIQRQSGSLIRSGVFDSIGIFAKPSQFWITDDRTQRLEHHDLSQIKEGFVIIGWTPYWALRREVLGNGGESHGAFIALSHLPIRELLSLWISLALVFALCAMGLQRAYSKVADRLADSIIQVDDALGKSDPTNFHRIFPNVSSHFSEIQRIVARFQELLTKVSRYERGASEIAKKDALIQLASQVAHDIRSPLTALLMVSQDLESVPENHRVLIRAAIQRIRDIANSLSVKNVEANCFLVASVVDRIVSEKRIQYRALTNISIGVEFNKGSYGLFTKVDRAEFARTLSNLIDNGIEAIEGKGHLTIIVSGTDKKIQLQIKDTGRGIPAEIIPNLFQMGATFKGSGTGLGLHHARKVIEQAGGTIEIQSQVGKGTSLVLELPVAKPPNWFVPVVHIPKQGKVVVLDDDPSVHLTWEHRLSEQDDKTTDQILHFQKADEFISWHRELSKDEIPLYLIDFDLGQGDSGLQLVQNLNIQKNIIFVTSRDEDEELTKQLSHLGVTMIPKNMVPYVPLAF